MPLRRMMKKNQQIIEVPPVFVYQRMYLKLHMRPVTAADFNLDGDMVFTASHDGYVGIWCAITGELLYTLGKMESAVRSASFSPNSEFIAIGEMGSTFFVYELGKNTPIVSQQLPEGEKGVRFIQFSDDGRTIYVVTLNYSAHFHVIEYAFGPNGLEEREISAALDGTPEGCLMHLDKLLISCHDGRVVTFNLLENDLDNEEDFGYAAPDITLWKDRYAVLPCARGKTVYLYDFQREVYSLKTEYDVNSCAVHPTKNICALAGGIDAKLVTTTENSDETLVMQFYDMEKKEMIFELKLHAGPTWRLRWSPDGLTLLSTSEDAGCCLLRFSREGFLE